MKSKVRNSKWPCEPTDKHFFKELLLCNNSWINYNNNEKSMHLLNRYCVPLCLPKSYVNIISSQIAQEFISAYFSVDPIHKIIN